jgi:hypothetical protein
LTYINAAGLRRRDRQRPLAGYQGHGVLRVHTRSATLKPRSPSLSNSGWWRWQATHSSSTPPATKRRVTCMAARISVRGRQTVGAGGRSDRRPSSLVSLYGEPRRQFRVHAPSLSFLEEGSLAASTSDELRAAAARMREFSRTVTDPDVLAEIDKIITRWERLARDMSNGDGGNSG